MSYLKVLLVGLVFSSCLQGEIRELKTMNDLRDLVNEKSLIFFDIDGTLIEIASTFAGPEHWHDCYDRFTGMGFDEERVDKFMSRIDGAILSELPLKLIEENTPKIVSDLQNKGIIILGLTARDTSINGFRQLDHVTRDNLEDMGFDLTHSHLPEGMSYKKQEKSSYVFSHGIIFSGIVPKGKALLEFLKNNNINTEHIIFIDDRLHNIESVQTSLQGTGIEFLGLHYLPSNKHKTIYDPIIAAIQMRAFLTGSKLLSEEEAQRIKNVHPNQNFDYYMKPLIDWIKADVEEQTLLN